MRNVRRGVSGVAGYRCNGAIGMARNGVAAMAWRLAAAASAVEGGAVAGGWRSVAWRLWRWRRMAGIGCSAAQSIQSSMAQCGEAARGGLAYQYRHQRKSANGVI